VSSWEGSIFLRYSLYARPYSYSPSLTRGYALPVELSDSEEFIRLSELATECRVKRLQEIVKLKLRTPSRLYTIRLDAGKADEVLKRLKCEVVEV